MEFSVPLRVKVSKNKFFILNINNYRNAHHRILSSAKRNFTDIIMAMDIRFRPFERCRVHYTYYPATNRKFDTMNVISVVDKFLMDALQKKGVIKDDHYKIVEWPSFEFGGVDRENPRIDVFIEHVS